MWKEHTALHLHVKNSVRLHQAKAWMIFFFFLTSRERKRKRDFFHESLLEGETHFMEEENDQDIINDVARVVRVLGDKNRKPCGPTQNRYIRREQWTELYNQKSDVEFPEKMPFNRTTFNLLLNTLWDGLVLTPTNSVLEPTSPDTQLAATLYRLAHRVHTPSWKTFLGFRKNRDAYFSTR